MIATLRKQDVKDDIAAALNMCLAIDLNVVEGHHCCPFAVQGVSKKAVDGLVRLLSRFDERKVEDESIVDTDFMRPCGV